MFRNFSFFFFDLQIYFPVIGTSCIPQNGDKYRVERKIKPYLRSFESCSALLVDTKTYLGKRLQKSPQSTVKQDLFFKSLALE